MPEFSLVLRRGAGVEVTASAWYLASSDCGDWLREVAGWGVPQAGLRLIPIPTSAGNRSAAGVLIISDRVDIRPSARCMPYTCVAPRVYAPCDAQLQPCLDERELSSLLSDDYFYVWHPGLGLIAADVADVFRPADLVAPLKRAERRWNRAVAGVAIGGRVTMLTPVEEMSFQQILEDSRGDIGAKQDALTDLPEGPAEPGDGLLDKAGRALVAGTAGALYSLSKLLPSGLGESEMVNKLKQMAADQVNKVMKVREDIRQKEISRLLNLLENNPDQGLKYALPLAALMHRGLAPPTNRLSQRKMDFNLSRLGGGRPANIWNLDANHRQKLTAKYRELANREMHLGRHRRAAYIFAELLGDMEAAALALANGPHYREAAVIYRDRLKRPLDAAKCLENGGLFSEAIEEYEALKMHERVGDLQRQLGNVERATEAYHQAANRFRNDSDFLSAARISEEKLNDPELAIEALHAGWPNSAQAVACIRGLFELFGRLGRHDQAAEEIQAIENGCEEPQRYTTSYSTTTDQHVRTADVLAELASGKYPDATVRETARLTTQRVVAARLGRAYRAEAQQLVAALTKLAPNDRLLERDGRRYVADIPVERPVSWTPRAKLHLKKTIKLGLPGRWHDAVAIADMILAAALFNDRITLRRCDFNGGEDNAFFMPWTEKFNRSDYKLFVVAGDIQPAFAGIYVMGEPPLPIALTHGSSDSFSTLLKVGAFPGTGSPVAIARSPNGNIYSLENRLSPVLQITHEQGDLIGTHEFEIDPSLDWEGAKLPLAMHARREHLFLGVGRHLFGIRLRGSETKTIELPSAVRQLVGSADHSRTRVVAGLAEGACVIWDPAGEHNCVLFATDMTAPCVGINRGGYVIAASGASVEIYDSKESKLTFVANHRLQSSPISVLTGTRTDQFGVMCENGDVLLFQL